MSLPGAFPSRGLSSPLCQEPKWENPPTPTPVRCWGEGAAGLPVVKIALTIGKGKKKRKPAVSPQWHAVPDPSARSFLKILMRRPSHPANGLATNRSTVRWAAAWRAGRHQQGPGPHLQGRGCSWEPQLELASLLPETPKEGMAALQSKPATQHPARLPPRQGAGPEWHPSSVLCSGLGSARPAPCCEPHTVGKPRPPPGAPPTQEEETGSPLAAPGLPGSWPQPCSLVSCPLGISGPGPAQLTVHFTTKAPSSCLRGLLGPYPSARCLHPVPCSTDNLWALRRCPTGQALNQGLLREGGAAESPRPSPPRTPVLTCGPGRRQKWA